MSRFLRDYIREQNGSINAIDVCVVVVIVGDIGFLASSCSFVVVDAADLAEDIVEGVGCKVA